MSVTSKVAPGMGSQDVSLNVDGDIAETQQLLSVVTRPIVRDRLLQLLGYLQQVAIPDSESRVRFYACTRFRLYGEAY